MRIIVFVGIKTWEDKPKGRMVPQESVKEGVQAMYGSHAGNVPTAKELEKEQLWISFTGSSKAVTCSVDTTQGGKGKRLEDSLLKVAQESVCMDVTGSTGR